MANDKKQKQVTIYLDYEDYEKLSLLAKNKLDKASQYIKKLVIRNIQDNQTFFINNVDGVDSVDVDSSYTIKSSI